MGSFQGRIAALLGKVKAIMNEANEAVREAAGDLVIEILGARVQHKRWIRILASGLQGPPSDCD